MLQGYFKAQGDVTTSITGSPENSTSFGIYDRDVSITRLQNCRDAFTKLLKYRNYNKSIVVVGSDPKGNVPTSTTG